MRRDWPALAVLAAAVFATYADVLSPSRTFLQYDDKANYVNNPMLSPSVSLPTALQLSFTEATLGVIEPVANIAKLTISRLSSAINNLYTNSPTPDKLIHGQAHSAFGVDVRAFLGATLLLHVVNTIIAARLAAKQVQLDRRCRHLLASAVALLLFGIHPLHTEVVAWASCFPYAIATCFALGAAHCHHEGKQVWAGVCLILAAFSKASSLSVFLALLVDNRASSSSRSSAPPPFTAAFYTTSSAVGLYSAVWANDYGGLRAGEVKIGLIGRIVKASHGFWWYPGRALRPWLPLSILYEVGDMSMVPASDESWSFDHAFNITVVVLTILCVGGAAALYLLRRDSASWQVDLARMILQYAIILAPVSGVVSHGNVTLAADRYAYIPFCIAIVPGTTSLLARLLSSKRLRSMMLSPPHTNQKTLCARVSAVITLVLVAVPLTELTRSQADRWRNDVKLWSHVLENTAPHAAVRGEITLNLATGLASSGHTRKAITLFREIFGESVSHSDTTKIGDDADAAGAAGAAGAEDDTAGPKLLHPAFQSNSSAAHAHHAFGNALLNFGGGKGVVYNNKLAQEQFEIAARADPMLAEPLASLAKLFHTRGSDQISESSERGGVLSRQERKEGVVKLDTALKYYSEARRVAEFGNTAAGLARRKQIGSRTDPNTVLSSGMFWLSYGVCSLEREKHRRFMPNSSIEEGNGEQQKLPSKAASASNIDTYAFFVRAAELAPDFPEVHYQLAKATKLRNGPRERILFHYLRCVALDPRHVNALFGMANYLQSQGDNEDAVKYYRKAVAIEPEATDLRINLALTLRTLGREMESLKEAKAILELDSFHSKATRLVEILTSKNAAAGGPF